MILIESENGNESFRAWKEGGVITTIRKQNQVKWEKEYDSIEDMIKFTEWHWWVLKGVQDKQLEEKLKEHFAG